MAWTKALAALVAVQVAVAAVAPIEDTCVSAVSDAAVAHLVTNDASSLAAAAATKMQGASAEIAKAHASLEILSQKMDKLAEDADHKRDEARAEVSKAKGLWEEAMREAEKAKLKAQVLVEKSHEMAMGPINNAVAADEARGEQPMDADQKSGTEGSPCGTSPYKSFGPCNAGLVCGKISMAGPYAPGVCHKAGAKTVTVNLVSTNSAASFADGGFSKYTKPGGVPADGGFDVSKVDGDTAGGSKKGEDWGQYVPKSVTSVPGVNNEKTTSAGAGSWQKYIPASGAQGNSLWASFVPQGSSFWANMQPSLNALMSGPGMPFNDIRLDDNFTLAFATDKAQSAAATADAIAADTGKMVDTFAAELKDAAEQLKVAANALRCKSHEVKVKAAKAATAMAVEEEKGEDLGDGALSVSLKGSSPALASGTDNHIPESKTMTSAAVWAVALSIVFTVTGGVWLARRQIRRRILHYEAVDGDDVYAL